MTTVEQYRKKLKKLSSYSLHGIYKITINDKFYIGSSVNLKMRLHSHISALLHKRHSNIYMQNSFNKYHIIDFDIIQIIDNPEKLKSTEQFYIDSLSPKLNLQQTADRNTLSKSHSYKGQQKIIKNIKKKLKEDGRYFRWFYDKFKIKKNADLTYSGFTAQLNSYAPLSDSVKKILIRYLHDN